MYDKVYSHLISSSQYRDTILQVLGQVIIAKGMADDVDALGIYANSSSPRNIATILGLEHDLVMRIAADFHLLLEGGDESSDIKIRQPSFLEFLLDFSRSQELFVDVNEATLRAIFHAEGMYVHPLPRTLIFMSLHQCFPWSLQIYTQAKTWKQSQSLWRLLLCAVRMLTYRHDSITYCQTLSLVNTSHLCVRHPGHGTLLPGSWNRSMPVWRSLYFILSHNIELLICFHESGFPSFGESDIETRLKAFWGAYTWEIIRRPSLVVPTKLEIRYVILIEPCVFVLTKFSSSLLDISSGCANILQVRYFEAQTWSILTKFG